MADTDLWTAQRVADWLHVELKTLGRWIDEGRFPQPAWIGGRRYWMWKDIERWYDVQKSLKPPRRKKTKNGNTDANS